MPDYSKAPYYNDYDKSKNYTAILAVPGRVEQAREFTQAQSIQSDYLARLGDSIYPNGTIISGCSIIINDKKVTITAGRIYLDGKVRITTEQTLNINAVGTEYIGAKIVQSTVTEVEDPSLKDPAQNYENYGQVGAHRIKEEVTWVRNDDNAAIVYTLAEGTLQNNTSGNAEDDTLITTLARRTYDENGSYKVDGLSLIDRNESNNDNILISVTAGKAYVKGYEITKSASSTVYLNFSNSVRSILSEPKIYRTGTKIYTLNNSPVKELTNVVCKVRVTEEAITRGNIVGGTDALLHTPVWSVVSVQSGDKSKTYENGTDYQLSGDTINWGLSGDEPAVGTTYYVTYIYNRTMIIGTDVKLDNSLEGTTYLSHIKFISNVLPVNNTEIDISYNFYLARKDLITMDHKGSFHVYEGEPDTASLCESPINQNESELTIGTALISAGYYSSAADSNLKTILLVTSNTTRLSQANLYNMKLRIDDLEYNQAMSDLDNEAAAGESATTLRGIFTDGFIGTTKADVTNKKFDCCIDTDNEELTLPVTSDIQNVTVNVNSNGTSAKKFGNNYVVPFTEAKAIDQPYATESLLVNPYSVYNPMSIVKLNPNIDNWIDSSTIKVNGDKTATYTLRRWWYHRGASWAESEKVKWLQLTGTTGEQLGWSNYNKTSTSTTSQIVLDEAITYMRSIPVNVEGSNFYPNSDNITCYFNDIKVNLTPTGSTSAGTNTGTVKANSEGKFTAKFTVPSNVPCGSVQVVLKNSQSSGSTIYSAEGRKQVIQNTVLRTKVTVQTQDPLAQSFSFNEDTIITKADLYFASKDPTKNLVIQIRDMVNGYPGTTIYDETVVNASDVKVSSDASLATTITFNQLVYCYTDTQYCLCILSDSNLYEMWIANLGDQDITTKSYVTSQPYVDGVLFTSSNALTWSVNQSQDLKFSLYKGVFSSKAEIQFNKVTTKFNVNRIVLAAQSIDYKNTGVSWFYKLTDEGSWLPIDTYVDRDLSKLSTNIYLKCILTAGEGVSPILSANTVNLVGFNDKSQGTYISRTVTYDNSFNTIIVSLEASKPSGTDFTVYYSLDGSTWKAMSNPTTSIVDIYFTKYTYTVNLSNNTSKVYKVKIVLAKETDFARPRIRKLINICRTV